MNAIEIIELRPRLHLFRFPVGQAYLWRDDEELTLVDAGPPGGGAALADAITGLGLRPRDVRRVVLTHFHGDHAGGAGEFAELTGATVYAHHLDAPRELIEQDLALLEVFAEKASKRPSLKLVIDMEAVEFLDSTGLGVLVGGLKKVRAHDGSMRLICNQERLLKIFRITGLAKVFVIHGSQADALAER